MPVSYQNKLLCSSENGVNLTVVSKKSIPVKNVILDTLLRLNLTLSALSLNDILITHNKLYKLQSKYILDGIAEFQQP